MAIRKHTPLAKFDDIPGELPEGTIPEDVDKAKIAQESVKLVNSLQESDLHPSATWRDLLSLTGYFRTFFSAADVSEKFQSLSKHTSRSEIRLKTDQHSEPRVAKSGPNCSWLDVDITFTTQLGSLQANCMGTVSVIPNADGNWVVWMLRTWVENFDGHGHPDQPSADPASVITNGTPNELHGPTDVEEFEAAIIGGGQAGLSTAGRLHALGVKYVLLEKHNDIGDNWAKRYDSLRWHTSKEYGVLPFGHTFPAVDDYSMPAKRIAAGHNAWSKKYGINARTSSLVESARWDPSARRWTITVSVKDGSTTLRARSLVLCIGPGHAKPIVPSWAAPDRVQDSGFRGTLLHAFDGYTSAAAWAGKRGVVIGTANTAHDVAEDMANAGMATTMVQRSPTFVFPAEWLHASQDAHYRADTTADDADKETLTYPSKILREMINRAVWSGIRASPDRFDALEKAGFKLDRYGDTYDNLYVRFGGHYVDIGASARIAKGEIKVKGEPVARLTENGLLFEDGTELGADLIVLATGFDHVFRNDAARIVGKDVADQMDEYWGVDAEGELRGHAKPAGREYLTFGPIVLRDKADFPADPNLYYHGGDVRMARFISRFIALQIQAEVLGQPLQPYRD